MEANFEWKTFYIISDSEVIVKAEWDDQIKVCFEHILEDFRDSVDEILSRFKQWISAVWLAVNPSEATDDGVVIPYVINMDIPVDIWDNIGTTNAELQKDRMSKVQ